MGNIFGKEKPLKEQLRESKRVITRAVRELDRETRSLQKEEKRLTIEIKNMARDNQMNAVKIMARDLVRTRQYITKFIEMRSRLQGCVLTLQTVTSHQAMAEAISSTAKVMNKMNKAVNVPSINKMMAEFERENVMSDMMQEMMADAIDDVMDGNDEDEEDLIVGRVLDEIGIDMAAPYSSTGNQHSDRIRIGPVINTNKCVPSRSSESAREYIHDHSSLDEEEEEERSRKMNIAQGLFAGMIPAESPTQTSLPTSAALPELDIFALPTETIPSAPSGGLGTFEETLMGRRSGAGIALPPPTAPRSTPSTAPPQPLTPPISRTSSPNQHTPPPLQPSFDPTNLDKEQMLQLMMQQQAQMQEMMKMMASMGMNQLQQQGMSMMQGSQQQQEQGQGQNQFTYQEGTESHSGPST
ncbi:hypothetical protein HJC23_009152 [Cyclotella cryptica]|uniref:SNF7 family protein n=1 Tax=Cyclotella cryptica TaxID=29204 RepID=A0ABD3P0V4_9STRA